MYVAYLSGYQKKGKLGHNKKKRREIDARKIVKPMQKKSTAVEGPEMKGQKTENPKRLGEEVKKVWGRSQKGLGKK